MIRDEAACWLSTSSLIRTFYVFLVSTSVGVTLELFWYCLRKYEFREGETLARRAQSQYITRKEAALSNSEGRETRGLRDDVNSTNHSAQRHSMGGRGWKAWKTSCDPRLGEEAKRVTFFPMYFLILIPHHLLVEVGWIPKT